MERLKELALFMVFSGVVLEVTANTKYHKFCEWVIGILFVLKLLQPMLIHQPVWQQLQYKMASFEYLLETEAAEDSMSFAEGQMKQSVRSAYEESLTNQIAWLLQGNCLNLLSVGYEFNETTGEIVTLKVVAKYQSTENNGNEIRVSPIEPVVLGEDTERKEELLTPMELYIGKLLADFYHIDKTAVLVEIKEEWGET